MPSASVQSEIDALVDRYGQALAAGRVPAADVVSADAHALHDRGVVEARAMGAVGAEQVTLTTDPSTLSVTGDRATVTAVGSYHLRGAAPGPASFTRALTAHHDPAGWRLVDDRGAATMALPWDLPLARRVENAQVVVIGNAPDATLRWYAEAAAAAWTRVGTWWPTLPAGKPVVVVPRSATEFAAQAGRAAAGDIAAVTVGSLARGRVARGDLVVVNPAVQQRLTQNGRRTILRHELTHVAIRGTTTGFAPQWLTEGFATQASWDGAGIPVQLRARAARWSPAQLVPADVPTDAEVESATGATHAYDTASLLVDDLVARHGRPAVVAFYRALTAGRTREDAAQHAFGESFAAVLQHWRSALVRVAAH